jgi:putative dimethyl sulfoxide reductase chaperone
MVALNAELRDSFRANTYWLLADCLRLPGKELAATVAQLREPLGNLFPELQGPLAQLKELLPTDERQMENLKVEFAQLFVGPFELAAPPYSSVYLGTERMVMGDATIVALNHYVAAGLDPAPENKEPPDHIATELEFMYFLIFQHLQTKESAFLERQKEFLLSHLSLWICDFARSIGKSGISPFYSRLAEITEAFLLRDRDYLEKGVPAFG